MAQSAPLFYALAFFIVISAIFVVALPNPIYSALSLAGSMIGLGFMYFQLEAYFIAGVQLIVYAGAVMVLFVMVLMLFDLDSEKQIRSRNSLTLFLKITTGALITVILFSAIRGSVGPTTTTLDALNPSEQMASVKLLATKLFTNYLFSFEILGVLLLIIAVGVVAISRVRGGTHAKH